MNVFEASHSSGGGRVERERRQATVEGVSPHTASAASQGI